MQQMRETQTRGAPAAGVGAALFLAVSLLALASAPATAEEAKTTSGSCSERYHASLGRIAKGEFEALKTAVPTPGTASAADAGLPGNLLFPPVSAGERTREETAALRYAASLARAKGRTGGGGADATWMANRLRVALADYLTQSPSPYLCSGVEDYVAELRGDARRLGPPPVQREALIRAQTSVVKRAVAAALAAMKPVPLPGEKPLDRPSGDPLDDLRPTTGIDRVDTTIATGSTVAAPLPAEDPDLPPLAGTKAPAFDTVADLVGAIDALTRAAAAGHYLSQPMNAMPIGGTLAVSATAYPVLSRLAEVRPIVTGVRPAVTDRTVRLRLATALSAIETLDYLMRARTEVADPVATAMDATFEAILKAHAADCTCRD